MMVMGDIVEMNRVSNLQTRQGNMTSPRSTNLGYDGRLT